MTYSIVTLVLFVSVFEAHASPNTMAALPGTMRAVGFYKYLPISDSNSLIDIEVKLPNYGDSDVLIEVKATSVNPVDVKLRAPKPDVETTPKILGFEGSGVVVAKGDSANYFNVGDEVFFTGDIRRSGSNAQYIAIDQILVGKKPKNLSFDQAAAMPATALTAYESLHDRLLISEKEKGKSLLIINSAGGVGSVATQLGKLWGLTVIGTASRTESEVFTIQNGADHVLNHTRNLIPQLKEKGFESGVDYILVNYDPARYWDTLSKVIKAEGKICLIVDSSAPLNLIPFGTKSVTLALEFVATRHLFNTDTKYKQHEILEQVSEWLDEGKLKTTLTKTLSPINADNLREAHRIIETGRMTGKLVVSNV